MVGKRGLIIQTTHIFTLSHFKIILHRDLCFRHFQIFLHMQYASKSTSTEKIEKQAFLDSIFRHSKEDRLPRTNLCKDTAGWIHDLVVCLKYIFQGQHCGSTGQFSTFYANIPYECLRFSTSHPSLYLWLVALGPCTHVGLLVPSFGQAQLSHCGHLQSGPADGGSLSLSLSLIKKKQGHRRTEF